MKQTTKKKWIIAACVVGVLAVLVAGLIIYARTAAYADEVSEAEAQELLDNGFASLGKTSKMKSVAYVLDHTKAKLISYEYGTESNIIIECEVTAPDVGTLMAEHTNSLLMATNASEHKTKTSRQINDVVDPVLCELLVNADTLTNTVTVEIFQDGEEYIFYASDDVLNTVFGGLLDTQKDILDAKTIGVDGEEIDISGATNQKKGVAEVMSFSMVSSRPDMSVYIVRVWNDFVAEFRLNFIEGARWKYLTNGLGTTLLITFFAALMGILLGFLVAIIRCTHDKIGKLKILNAISNLYLTVIRGTPVMVQLMIIYFVIFMPLSINKVLAAIICFGLNSGAYVAEIVRGGIMSIDQGQFEAGRSLGFNYTQTMFYIVMPQAFKAVLPALANEFIVLLKETSVSAYIGISDLARGGDIIRGVTFSAFMPLIAVALIYLVIVMGLSQLVKLLERRLRKSDRG